MTTETDLKQTNEGADWTRMPGTLWLVLALAAGLGTSACNETSSTSAKSSLPSAPQDAGGVQALDSGENANGVDAGGVVVNGTRVSITLPRDVSRYPDGPAMPLADGAPCLACHDTGDVSEFTRQRSVNFELVKEECTGCHSADYALYQPPQTNAGWAKVVKKMADKFDTTVVNGVPTVDVMLNPVHQALMTDYLTAINGM